MEIDIDARMRKGRRKNYKGTRLIRSFSAAVSITGNPQEIKPYEHQETKTLQYNPEVQYGFNAFGLDSHIKLGKVDLEKLGNPTRIKVVIYNIDDND